MNASNKTGNGSQFSRKQDHVGQVATSNKWKFGTPPRAQQDMHGPPTPWNNDHQAAMQAWSGPPHEVPILGPAEGGGDEYYDGGAPGFGWGDEIDGIRATSDFGDKFVRSMSMHGAATMQQPSLPQRSRSSVGCAAPVA